MKQPTRHALPASASGSAWGKVILLGEHSVVYGRRALASAISRQVEVQVTDLYSAALHENGRNGAEDLLAADPRFRAAVVRAAELLELDAGDLRIHVESNLPAGVGLGSSAAVSVALVRALAAYAGAECCQAEVCAHAYELERIFHGTPSGIDNAAATHGGLFVFRRGEPPLQLGVPRPLPLVVAVGKTPRQTQRAVAGVRERWQAQRAVYEAIFDAIDALVGVAGAALAGGDLIGAGSAMNENHELLRRIGVSTEELDELVRVAREGGALGAKLTGGGGGGAVICLCETLDAAELLARRCARSGWDAFTTSITSALPAARVAPQRNPVGRAAAAAERRVAVNR